MDTPLWLDTSLHPLDDPLQSVIYFGNTHIPANHNSLITEEKKFLYYLKVNLSLNIILSGTYCPFKLLCREWWKILTHQRFVSFCISLLIDPFQKDKATSFCNCNGKEKLPLQFWLHQDWDGNECFIWIPDSGVPKQSPYIKQQSSLTWNKLIWPVFIEKQRENGILKWIFALHRFGICRRGIWRLRVTRPMNYSWISTCLASLWMYLL